MKETMAERKRRQDEQDKAFAELVTDAQLNLPPLLEERRKRYWIPDEVFTKVTALFSQVFVWQIPIEESETVSENSVILAPDSVIQREKHTSGRGILISAGLVALDTLESHGVRLGDIVRFRDTTPYIVALGRHRGHQIELLELEYERLMGSEDLARRISSGETGLSRDSNGSLLWKDVNHVNP